MVNDIVFSAFLAILVVISLIHLIKLGKADKRLDRNLELLERYCKLLEKDASDKIV